MRVVLVGANGAVRDAVLQRLLGAKRVEKVVLLLGSGVSSFGIASESDDVEQRRVDLLSDLSDHFRHADAVVYLGYPVNGSDRSGSRERHLPALRSVCEGLATAGVQTFVYGSSAGAYAPAPGHVVDEDWPTQGDGTPSSVSQQFAEGERLVDQLEADCPMMRVVRLRPGLVVCPSPVRRSWRSLLGRRLVATLFTGESIRLIPDLGLFQLQAVHVADLAYAYQLAVTESVIGAFNVAADSITSDLVATTFDARKVPLSPRHAAGLLSLFRRSGLSSVASGQLELALRYPAMDTTRAHSELGWRFEYSATSLLTEWGNDLAAQRTLTATGDLALDSDEVAAATYRRFYSQSLSYFGKQVHAIRDDQGETPTGCGGRTVWQLVAFVAREQYRTALVLEDKTEARIEAQLPDDALGFVRIDGWSLAAERGTLAVDTRFASRSNENSEASYRLLNRVLPDTICEVALFGWCLSKAIGNNDSIEPELASFVHDRMTA